MRALMVMTESDTTTNILSHWDGKMYGHVHKNALSLHTRRIIISFITLSLSTNKSWELVTWFTVVSPSILIWRFVPVFIEERVLEHDLLISHSDFVIIYLKVCHCSQITPTYALLCFCSYCMLEILYLSAQISCSSFNLSPHTKAAFSAHEKSVLRFMLCSWIESCTITLSKFSTNRRQGVLLTNEMIPASSQECSSYFFRAFRTGSYPLTGFLHSRPPGLY